MELRTEIQIPRADFTIDHHKKVYLTGSCFSENIATKFRYFGFQSLANSHGIIYNPYSINQSLDDLAHHKEYTANDFEFYEGRYFSYHHHGEYSSIDADDLTVMINESLEMHRNYVKESSVVFVTLGTAWIYTIPHKNLIVANCHKMPSKTFTKNCMSLPRIEETLKSIIENIYLLNPGAKIIFTVSPVKHLNDGFINNQLSKSLLHVAIQKILTDHIYYFPAYEIMNDDLRDYRFWKQDMTHPNQLAIDYIWEKLSKTYFDLSTEQVLLEVKKLRQFLDHIPLSSDPVKIDELNQEKERKRAELNKKYPQLYL